MGDIKTPEEMAKKEVNKKLGEAIAKRELKKKRLEAEMKKVDKEIEKIKNGELVPEDDESSSSHPRTLINFLLDESGSMQYKIYEVIDGFNEYIQKMKREKGKVTMTLTKFSSRMIDIVYAHKNVKDVVPLNKETYSPDGMTPLYDAIGKTINTVAKGIDDKKHLNVLMVIMTDGFENESKEYTLDMIKSLIKTKENEGWTFVFMASDLSKETVMRAGGSMGIRSSNIMAFKGAETKQTFAGLAMQSASFHRGRKQVSSFFKQKKN